MYQGPRYYLGRVFRAYMTVSPDDASLLLADMPSADLLATENLRIRKRYTQVVFSNDACVSRSTVRSIEHKAAIQEWHICVGGLH